MFIAQVLVGPNIKRHKEIVQIGRGVELEATEKQLPLAVKAGLEPGTSGFQVRRPNSLDHALRRHQRPQLFCTILIDSSMFDSFFRVNMTRISRLPLSVNAILNLSIV